MLGLHTIFKIVVRMYIEDSMTEKTKKQNYKDMTVGKPLPIILSFALPLFIGNIFQQVYSIVDTMIAGYNIGDEAIAAIGATASLYSLIVNFAFGTNAGTSIVVSRCFGSKNMKNLKASIAGMVKINIVISIILTVLTMGFMKNFLNFIHTPQEIYGLAYSYIRILCIGIVATVTYNAASAILRSLGNSRTALYFLIIASILNAVLDAFFIIVLKTGIVGAAYATVISQSVAAILSVAYILKNYKQFLPSLKEFKTEPAMLKDLLSTGIAMALMYCVVDFGSVLFQSANNALGPLYITSHTAARRLIVIMMTPMSTFAGAFSTFVAQNFGASKPDRIKSGLKQVLLIETIWSAFAIALIFSLGGFLARITTGTDDPEIIKNAVLSMRIHLPLYPFLGVLFVLRNTLQSMSHKVAPVICSSLEMGIKLLSALFIIPRVGFIGTCVTEPTTWVVCMIFISTVYFIDRKKLYNVSCEQ